MKYELIVGCVEEPDGFAPWLRWRREDGEWREVVRNERYATVVEATEDAEEACEALVEHLGAETIDKVSLN